MVVAVTSSPAATDARINDTWPSWRYPIVGPNPPRLPSRREASRRPRNAAIFFTTSMRRDATRATSEQPSGELDEREVRLALARIEGLDVARDGLVVASSRRTG